jgi:hypothetical protein
VLVHQNSHSGTVNIVLFAQQELNSTKKKNNAITAQTDSLETDQVTPVFQDFDKNLSIYYCFIVFAFQKVFCFGAKMQSN